MSDGKPNKSSFIQKSYRVICSAMICSGVVIWAPGPVAAQSTKSYKIPPEQIGPVRSGSKIEFLPLSNFSTEDREKIDRATDRAYRILRSAIARDTGGKLGAVHEVQKISCGFGANPGTSVSSIWVVCSIGHYYCQVGIDDAGGELNVSGSCGSNAPVPATPATP